MINDPAIWFLLIGLLISSISLFALVEYLKYRFSEDYQTHKAASDKVIQFKRTRYVK